MIYILLFIFLLLFWVIFSGLFDAWHLGLGIVSCGIVTWLCRGLLPKKLIIRDLLIIPRFLIYIPWLLWQIVLANIYMIYIVFHPRMRDIIFPHVVKFRSQLKGDLGLTTFANSITLTPGTITIAIDRETFYVHAINEKVAQSLPGEMEKRVKKIFREK
ncbi:MAG: Na+/H+ antiporter subunit E [Syntrophales bacterium]|nr:Na+/H+ antiporter subunit E [Syntrophales bacterium]